MVTLVAIRGLIISVPSLVEEHGLKSRAQWLWRMDLVALGTCGIFPEQGSNPALADLQARICRQADSLTTRPPGKPTPALFIPPCLSDSSHLPPSLGSLHCTSVCILTIICVLCSCTLCICCSHQTLSFLGARALKLIFLLPTS